MEKEGLKHFTEKFCQKEISISSLTTNRTAGCKTADFKIIGLLSNCSVNVFGDGCFDSPGFNVKYGTDK